MPPSSGGHFILYQIADLHRKGMYVPAILEHYNKHYAKENIPAVIISVGDFYSHVPAPFSAQSRTDQFLKSLSMTGDVFKHIPLLYMWDDHDYGGGNSAGRFYLPRADDPAVPPTVWDWTVRDHPKPLDNTYAYSYEIAGIPFIVSDQRTARTGQTSYNPFKSDNLKGNEPCTEKNTIFGKEQHTWIKKQLDKYKLKGLLFFVSSTLPLDNIGDGTVYYPPTTFWGVRDSFGLYYKAERNELFKYAVDYGYGNRRTLVFLCGDDHRNAVWDEIDFASEPWPANEVTSSPRTGIDLNSKIFLTRSGAYGNKVAGQSYHTFGPANRFDDWQLPDPKAATCTIVWNLNSKMQGRSVKARITFHSLFKNKTYLDAKGRKGDFYYQNGTLSKYTESDDETADER